MTPRKRASAIFVRYLALYLSTQSCLKHPYELLDRVIAADLLDDFFACVDYCAMIATTESLADVHE